MRWEQVFCGLTIFCRTVTDVLASRVQPIHARSVFRKVRVHRKIPTIHPIACRARRDEGGRPSQWHQSSRASCSTAINAMHAMQKHSCAAVAALPSYKVFRFIKHTTRRRWTRPHHQVRSRSGRHQHRRSPNRRRHLLLPRRARDRHRRRRIHFRHLLPKAPRRSSLDHIPRATGKPA